jgi:signal transduction histidine kinase
MPLFATNIILQVVIITVVFLVAAVFLLWYVYLYNQRKKKREEEKRRMEQQFKEVLAHASVEVQEQTLKTIAADIHDNIGQLLSLTKITLSTVNAGVDPEKATRKVEDAVRLLEQSMRELRQLAAVLHAENLLAEGLPAAIARQLERINRSDHCTATLHCSGEEQRPANPQRELIAFRIVQELLGNSLKHAAASAIDVFVQYSDAGIEITVADNGKGFDPGLAKQQRNGMGLRNFEERARVIGARFRLSSAPGQGTKAWLLLPYG